jgi:hypothetical protein
MADHYILDGHTPVAEPDLMAWARWFESSDRRVALTELDNGVNVSTVFLGSDHSFGQGAPILFETMSFGTDEEVCERYSTWDEARAGHDAIVASLTNE